MKKIIATFIALLIVVTPFSACKKNKDGLIKIRLNEVTHSIFYAPLYIAIENGFFEEEGLEIELTNGGGADKTMTALLSGDADIGLMGVEATVYVYLEGKKDVPKIIGQLTKRDGSFLVSRVDEPDFKWEDLEGKEIIAGRTGGVPAMTFEYVVNKHGLYNGQNVTLNNDVAFNLMGPSFEGGTGDYTTLFEPTASEYQRAGKGYIVASVGEESGEIPYTAFTALSGYIKNNGETVEKFIRAMYKAIKYMAETDDAVLAESLLKQFPDTSLNSVATALASYKRIDAWMTHMAMTETAFNNLLDVMENAGELERRIDYSLITDNTYANSLYGEIFK
ncbi:MAG: ABC transporter substrate-binding protein [Clostridia bacterium]|nr:ABC transporter substrate-binding protein [Clostridia bacterium]